MVCDIDDRKPFFCFLIAFPDSCSAPDALFCRDGSVVLITDADMFCIVDMPQCLQQTVGGIVVFGAVHESLTEHDLGDSRFVSFNNDPLMFICRTVIHRDDLNLLVNTADVGIGDEITAE